MRVAVAANKLMSYYVQSKSLNVFKILYLYENITFGAVSS
jgi:hypothetical protein